MTERIIRIMGGSNGVRHPVKYNVLGLYIQVLLKLEIVDADWPISNTLQLSKFGRWPATVSSGLFSLTAKVKRTMGNDSKSPCNNSHHTIRIQVFEGASAEQIS